MLLLKLRHLYRKICLSQRGFYSKSIINKLHRRYIKLFYWGKLFLFCFVLQSLFGKACKIRGGRRGCLGEFSASPCSQFNSLPIIGARGNCCYPDCISFPCPLAGLRKHLSFLLSCLLSRHHKCTHLEEMICCPHYLQALK